MNPRPRTIEKTEALQALRLVLTGRVQGVGFRPFVYRLAQRWGLNGWVRNSAGRVVIHIEGGVADVEAFTKALTAAPPPLAKPRIETAASTPFEGCADFRILASTVTEPADIHLPPDLFCCDDCLAELQSPAERRHRYAFTNCTQCGPRYTITRSLPYDRPATSMAGFALCPECRAEYNNPSDRRFHAQPLACPQCGPRLTFHRNNTVVAKNEAALDAALAALSAGEIVAVKGIGGYLLMCDAAADGAIARLRARKHRPDKPLAVMFPQIGEDGLDAVRACVTLTKKEAEACTDATRPIVLARRRVDCRLSAALAPGLDELGVFLPYSPLHHLLLAGFGRPLVATSGNISGEPVITDNDEAQKRLGTIADAFLHHDRPILRPADDSVIRVIAGAPRPVRIGRGMAPLELNLDEPLREPIFATGGQMKATVALAWDRRVVVSPHIGELDSPRSQAIFERVVSDLQSIYQTRACRIVCDRHPGYAPTRWALKQGLPVIHVSHHIAHASGLAGEYPQVKQWLVFAWDGLGLGDKNELWGGEAFIGAPGAWRRIAGLRQFSIIGGDRVAREPWRAAAALLWETARAGADDDPATALAREAWRKRIGTVRTSSVGRLFDAAAALVIGLKTATFEGQGPMMLESIAAPNCEPVALPITRDADGLDRTDWAPLLPILTDRGISPPERAGIFHATLAAALCDQAARIAHVHSFEAVGLTGGVFQNRRLAEHVTAILTKRGLRVRQPQLVPANDGGLAFGQIIEARALMRKNTGA